ncbi:MAG TPA: hypothetical protein VF546_16580 [Pyrinomonadaceae bacterium]|jgi:hypothetical protein
MEKKLKHLDLIQGVITRMAGNSFYLKGWCVTVVAAILGLASKDTNKKFLAVIYYPIIMFWIIDGYYLFQEKLYRRLFDDVRKTDEASIDFSMDTRPYKGKKTNWLSTMFSHTLLIFYGIMFLATLIAMLIISGIL